MKLTTGILTAVSGAVMLATGILTIVTALMELRQEKWLRWQQGG